MQQLPRVRLGDILVTSGVITDSQLEHALELQKTDYMRIGEALMQAGSATEDDILEAMALQFEVPFVELGEMPISPETIKTIPEPLARAYKVFPISVAKDKLALAMANPNDVEAIEAVQRVTKKRVEPVLTSAERIKRALDETYAANDSEAIIDSIEQAADDIEIEDTDLDNADFEDERKLIDEAPVVKAVNLVMQEAIASRASDIHIEPRASRTEIRYRIDGALHHMRDLPKKLQAAIVSRIKIMADLDIAEKRKPHDGRITVKVQDKTVDMRISTFPTQHGERVVIRILDKSSKHFELNQLGFHQEDLERFEDLITKPHGIVLVTGPTGSGKTTTLYSSLNSIKSEQTNIMTCEDPIEYELEGINQSQINVRAGLTFASQLRAILRQDPDVILVGEIRDKETAEIAFQAAMTGHLVFSTLHCNDAPSAPSRLLDLGTEPFLIASSVIGVVAQRLVRQLCPRCKTQYEPTVEELAAFGLDPSDDAQYYRAVGCSHCDERGYRGRVPVLELLTVNEEVRHLIAQRASTDEVRKVASANGMKSLGERAAYLVQNGVTTFEEILKRVFVEEG